MFWINYLHFIIFRFKKFKFSNCNINERQKVLAKFWGSQQQQGF